MYVSIFHLYLLSIHIHELILFSHLIYRRVSFLKALSSINDDENISSSNTKTKRTVPNRPSVKRTSLNLNSDNDIITFIANEMRSNFLFQSCNHSTIVNLARQFVVCEYEPGYAIIEQGKRCMLHCIFTYSYTYLFKTTTTYNYQRILISQILGNKLLICTIIS